MQKIYAGASLVLLSLLSCFTSFNLGGTSPQRLDGHTTSLAVLAAPTIAPSFNEDDNSTDYISAVCVQGLYQWQPAKLPIKVCITPGNGVPGYRASFPGFVRNALDTWCAASGGKLSWKEVKTASAADVNVRWTDQVTQRSNGTEAGETNAYTRLDTSTGRGIIYGAKMTLLAELPNKQFTDTEMDKTILHETGHALGLQGHSPVRTDIMYYSINPDQQPALTERDEATMAHLYADYPAEASDVAVRAK